MGVSRALLDLASFIEPESIHWLTIKEAREVMLDNMLPIVTNWRLDTNADGLVFATASVVIPGPHSTVVISVLARGGQSFLIAAFAPADADQASALAAVRTDESVKVSIDGVVIEELPSSNWTVGSGSSVLIEIPLAPASFLALATGTQLRLAVFVPHCCQRYDPSV